MIDNGAVPATYQPRFIVAVGPDGAGAGVRVITFAFVGTPVFGDRPDQKVTPLPPAALTADHAALMLSMLAVLVMVVLVLSMLSMRLSARDALMSMSLPSENLPLLFDGLVHKVPTQDGHGGLGHRLGRADRDILHMHWSVPLLLLKGMKRDVSRPEESGRAIPLLNKSVLTSVCSAPAQAPRPRQCGTSCCGKRRSCALRCRATGTSSLGRMQGLSTGGSFDGTAEP